MNKTMKMWMLVVTLGFCGASMVGCGNKADKPTENSVQTETAAQTGTETMKQANCLTFVDDYLVNVIGKNYAQGDVCIPYAFVVSTDEGDPDDVLVWGDFWVFNYNLSGDTLKTVSGGNHPGLMHLKKTSNGFEVTGFDAVEDGTGNTESAKRIFGDKYDAYAEISGLDEKREDMRMRFTADYVKTHNLSAKLLQDFGWPAVALPE